MAEYFRGARAFQVPTRLIPPARVSAAIPMVFGCAPIHRLPADSQANAMPGSIVLAQQNSDAEEALGIKSATDDFKKWGLSMMAFSHFNLFNLGPVLFVNLFNPEIHFSTAPSEELLFVGSVGNFTATLKNTDVIKLNSVNNFTEGEDFTINKITGVITVIPGKLLEEKLLESGHAPILANYTYAAPEMVTANDCIGGYDIETGETTGLELIEDVFPLTSLIPGGLVAPHFSENPVVAAIMAAKTQRINSVFTSVAYGDIPTDGVNGVKLYTKVPEYKNKNSLVYEDMLLCWPKAKVGDREISLSVLACGTAAETDAANMDIPFASNSNKTLPIQGIVAGGEEVILNLSKANRLAGNGVSTALNFNGWKSWGGRTAAYPGATDPKDVFFSSRRMFAWYSNRLILTYFQKVDDGINNRLIQTIVNSEQINLNSLGASEALLPGSRIEFTPDDNAIINIMDGLIRFRILLGMVVPAEEIDFILEFDPTLLEALFAA